MIWDFGCFPWSCTNLVIEQLTIPSSKHLSHPVAYFIHHATSVAKANAGKSKFYIEHAVPPWKKKASQRGIRRACSASFRFCSASRLQIYNSRLTNSNASGMYFYISLSIVRSTNCKNSHIISNILVYIYGLFVLLLG